MKKMMTAAALAAALLLTACGNAASSSAAEPTPTPDSEPAASAPAEDIDGEFGVDEEMPEPDAELKEIVDKMTAVYDVGLMMVETVAVDLNDEAWYTYQTGLNPEQAALVDAAVLTEPGIGSQPYSMVLLRVKNAEDAQTIADAVLNGVNMHKWVCVAADHARVVTFGDKVLFVMAEDELVDVDKVIESAATALNVSFDYDASREEELDDDDLPPELLMDQPAVAD